MSKMTKDEVYRVQMARWEGWRQLARKLPDHHILAVELLRTANDETAAVFTAVRNQEPIQYLVRGDARGRLKAPVKGDQGGFGPSQGHGHGHGHGRDQDDCGPGQHRAALALDARGEPPVDANSIALGEPPPKEPPPPGITALAGVILPAAFDLGEQVVS
jgi:hypothetical protein